LPRQVFPPDFRQPGFDLARAVVRWTDDLCREILQQPFVL
jgi:hypothetical protein